MTIRRTFAPLALAIAPALLAHCSSETPADNPAGGGSSSAGAGNVATGGASGSAGSATGGSGLGGAASGSGGTGGALAGTSGAGAGGGAGSSGAGGAASGNAGIGGASGNGGLGGAASGAGGAASGAGGKGGASGTGGGGAFVLTSSKIVTDMEMPAEFTCASTVLPVSPPLAWSGVPAGTMSFALVFVDTTIINASMTDARGYHSAIWDMPASTMALPENVPTGATITTPVMAKQFGAVGGAKYLGPCPNNGAAPADTYEFRLFALPVATLTGQLTTVRGILQAITAAGPLGTAVLRARSDASGTLR